MPSMPPVRPHPGSTRRSALVGAGAALALGRGAVAAPTGCGTPPCAFGPTTGWPAARAGLEAMLSQSLLPFWRPVADRTGGEGYALNHDLDGRWLGPADPALVSQARMLWFFGCFGAMAAAARRMRCAPSAASPSSPTGSGTRSTAASSGSSAAPTTFRMSR